jgi:hypothetical protein
MEHDPVRKVATPLAGPEATLRETVWSVSVDAAELARRLPDDDASARVLDKLSEELAEAAQAHRALPGRPVPMPGHDYQLLGALRSARAAGEDVGEAIARALARLAAETGGTVAELLRTAQAAGDDENLPALRTTS